MSFSKQEIQTIYGLRAKHYDFYVGLYRLLGFRHETCRRRAVELLRLQRGDCVVDLGCGTGLNFSPLIKQIGPEGCLIGVDLSAEMLTRARKKIHRAGWTNVSLIQSDMAVYDYPNKVKGVLSTGALGYVSEYDRVIEKAMHALTPGGRLVVRDLKLPERWPAWLSRLFLVWLGRPFGVTIEYVHSHPWESVERYFEDTAIEHWYGGTVYISSGTAPKPGPNKMMK